MPEQEAVTALMDRMIRALEQLPPFSPILNKLLATMAGEDVSFAQVAALIESDTVLAGNVLKVVNSALYGFRGTVNSVRHAVAILGVDRLRNLSLGFSVARMWTHIRTPEGWSGSKFNQHSLAVGILSDLLAQRAQAPYPEGAFVAGLLHDIGKLLIATSVPAEFGGILWLLKEGGANELECETEMLGTTHAELSGIALENWNLPLPIRRSAAFHHVPDRADEGRLHLSHVVYAADRLANELGNTIGQYFDQSARTDGVFDALGVAGQMPRILEEFEAEFESVKGYF
ncbi:MAG: HDOD domain-containing protein [Bryobacteraceae bacterium]|jgi:HD-like signal output (HDOD) protein